MLAPALAAFIQGETGAAAIYGVSALITAGMGHTPEKVENIK